MQSLMGVVDKGSVVLVSFSGRGDKDMPTLSGVIDPEGSHE